MNSDILSVIQSGMSGYSKGQKLIARYILDSYDKAAFMTASKLGKTVNVSESTVVRFAVELGYDGYPSMQRALQELEARGLLNTQRTAGRTVTEDEIMIAQLREQLAAEQIGAFLQMMEKLGYTRAQTLALLQQKAQEE